jgi:hypothetical protein
MLRKKAFIFTLDAVFAIILATTLSIGCFFYLSQTLTNIYQNQDIYKISSDSLTILEKDGTLKNTIHTGNISYVQTYLDSLPSNICGNITIYNTASAQMNSMQKSGCTTKNISAMTFRVFTDGNNNTYYAKMEGWYR